MHSRELVKARHFIQYGSNITLCRIIRDVPDVQHAATGHAGSGVKSTGFVSRLTMASSWHFCLLVIFIGLHGGNGRFLMPWMCLERCGGNASSISANLKQIAGAVGLVTAVSYEQFNLGPEGALVTNNLTRVGPG